jgi:predicted HAD superfamily Cof-like phosphohydrolase
MNNPFNDQKEFMEASGQTTDRFNPKQSRLYLVLIDKEYQEYMDTIAKSAEELKEMIDVLVVVIGKIISIGVDPQKAWNIVHANNMAEVGENTQYDENGEIIKSEESKARKAQMMKDLQALIDEAMEIK